ncbi:MAG: DUF998 domain-containing protein [Candidatus Hermodarchaeota archaeon]
MIKSIFSYLDKIFIAILTLELLKSWKRIFCIATLLGGFQFILLTFIAMFFYPDGYSFTQDYFSYLGTTINIKTGSSNIVSRILFIIACVVAGATLIPFWIVSSTMFNKSTLLRYIRKVGSLMGIISSVFLMGVGVFAEDANYFLHSSSAKLFFTFVIIAILIHSFAILLDSDYQNIYSFTGIAFCITSVILLYVFRSSIVINIIMQKVIVYGFCIWVVVQISKIWKNLEI